MSPLTEPEPWHWRDGPYVVGLDLSLQFTGIAYADGSTETIDTAKRKLRGMERLLVIRSAVRLALDVLDHDPDLVVIEGYSFGSQGRSVIQLGELGGVIRVELALAGIRWVECPPGCLKKYATGKGRGVGKPEMVSTARERLGFPGYDDNQADAAWLRAAGLDLLGAPLVDLPVSHREALKTLSVQLERPSGEPE